MQEVAHLAVYLLAGVGLTVLVVWPDAGPAGWLRDTVFRSILPPRTRGVLDCYICLSFWVGVCLSVVFWLLFRDRWVWFGCLMLPGLFWMLLGRGKS